MKWDNTLLAYESDIKQRSLKQWLRAYTTFVKPRHKYTGILELINEKLRFAEQNDQFSIEIETSKIKDMNFGFDKTFRRLKDKQIGLFGFKPLKIIFEDKTKEDVTIYLFAQFNNSWKIVRTSKNRELYAALQASII
ncbi:MAG: hypothetical protein ACXAD7_00490 [Candidatus Kariarchaeaceae archaeon]|jgi:hypothetical protein